MENLSTFMNPARLEALTTKGIALGTNVLIALLILIVGLWISKKVKNGISGMAKKSPQMDETVFNFLGSIVRWAIMAVVFMAVLGRFGIETTSIVAMLGAATVAIGLALQGAMGNLAAGVMLMIFRPYKMGDFIDAAGTFGNVEDINLFTTDLQTFDNQKIIIPNGKIWGEKIINHSHHPVRGVEMRFNVAYGDDTDKARKVISDVLSAHPHIKSDPAPFIEVETLSERSVEILARPFTDGAHYFDVLYSVPELVKKALGKAGMETPYPSQKIIMVKE